MEHSVFWCAGFNIFVLAILALDLEVFHHKSKELSGLKMRKNLNLRFMLYSFSTHLLGYFKFKGFSVLCQKKPCTFQCKVVYLRKW